MISIHDTEERSIHRLPRSAAMRSEPPVARQTEIGALQRTVGAFSADLQAAEEGDQDAAVLSVRGEIDLETATVLFELMLSVLERRTGPVVVDLSEVPFIDSSGVHFLVDTFWRLQDQSRRFAIACRERGQVHRLLALAGLLELLTVHRSRESALTDGDDLIRSEPGSDTRPSDARAL